MSLLWKFTCKKAMSLMTICDKNFSLFLTYLRLKKNNPRRCRCFFGGNPEDHLGSKVGQPHDHIGWATSMLFASINTINPRTNPWKFREKILRIGSFENLSFFESAILIFFFASFPWKSVKVYRLARMGWVGMGWSWTSPFDQAKRDYTFWWRL